MTLKYVKLMSAMVLGLMMSGEMEIVHAQQYFQQPAANVSGTWTIYANNIEKPGSSLKTVTLSQNGNILTGKFKGPHQSGKLQGWVNGNHVEFSTDTHEVLTFRGEYQGGQMSGLYGINGRHAPWKAERTQ